MQKVKMSIVETGNTAILNTRKQDTVIFESGNVYRLYGRKSEQKVKLIGESRKNYTNPENTDECCMKIFHKRIDEIQKDEDEYLVYLKYDFQIQEGLHHSPVHCFGEQTIHDIKETMKDVSICKCNECEKNKPD